MFALPAAPELLGNSRSIQSNPSRPTRRNERLAPFVPARRARLLYFFRIVKEQPITLVQETRSKQQQRCRLLLDSSFRHRGSGPLARWWSWTGSNRRPPACKAGALPTELQPRRTLVGLDGFEPSTPALSRRCSNQLSYRPLSGNRGRIYDTAHVTASVMAKFLDAAGAPIQFSRHLATTDKREHWNARAFRERR